MLSNVVPSEIYLGGRSTCRIHMCQQASHMLTLSAVVLVEQHLVQIKKHYGKTEMFRSYFSHNWSQYDSNYPRIILFNTYVVGKRIIFHSLLSAVLYHTSQRRKRAFSGRRVLISGELVGYFRRARHVWNYSLFFKNGSRLGTIDCKQNIHTAWE